MSCSSLLCNGNARCLSAGEFPWQVSLQLLGGWTARHICGAAVLSAYWVVTAGHCTAGLTPTALSVVAGDHDLYKEEGKCRMSLLSCPWAPQLSPNVPENAGSLYDTAAVLGDSRKETLPLCTCSVTWLDTVLIRPFWRGVYVARTVKLRAVTHVVLLYELRVSTEDLTQSLSRLELLSVGHRSKCWQTHVSALLLI